MTTKQEGILIELQGLIDNLKEAKTWHEVDDLTNYLQLIYNALEEALE